jgi:hypothetical protein
VTRPSRTARAAAAIGIAAAAVVLLWPAAADSEDANALRAVASYSALERSFALGPGGLLRERSGSAGVARAWPFSQALAATISMVNVRDAYRGDVRRRLRALERYRTSGGYAATAGGGALFYDDNEWLGIELTRWHTLSGDRAALARAERLFDLVVSGWDADPGHACPGGVFWTRARGVDDRGTVSTANGARLGLRLYALTGKRRYIDWSERMYNWVVACMRAPNGLFWDHIAFDGTRDEKHWSYNQGAMIGVNVFFYRLTGDTAFLDRAREVAATSLELFERTPTRAEPPEFLAIFFHNLMLLYAVDRDPRYREAAQDYADAVWTQARDPRSGLFRFGAGPVQLLEQSAMVQIYALLASTARLATAAP